MCMSELDRQVAALDRMDRDELRTACEEQIMENMALKTALDVAKAELTDVRLVKNDYAKIVLGGIYQSACKGGYTMSFDEMLKCMSGFSLGMRGYQFLKAITG